MIHDQRPKIAAIVPAWNEEHTVAEVVRVLKSSNSIDTVIVVSDGSTDATAEVARSAGADHVIALPKNQGKGDAMRAGVEATDAPIIAFFDADLVGLNASHVEQLIFPVISKRYAMHVGIRDRGSVLNFLTLHWLPRVSGERVMQRFVFEKIPSRYRAGYKVETALNFFCAVNTLASGASVLRGLTIRRKMDKVGFWRGLFGYLRMTREMIQSHLELARHRLEFVYDVS